jgi:hypothetical protein
MRSSLQVLLVAGVFCFFAAIARADSEIVIAIRYLQAQGTSHSHLYLYREDGKLLRQLTKDDSGKTRLQYFPLTERRSFSHGKNPTTCMNYGVLVRAARI